MGTLPDEPPGARHGSSLSSTTCSPASVDMGTRQELAVGTLRWEPDRTRAVGPPHRAMGTLHMSVQRGNETAVAAVGLQLAGETPPKISAVVYHRDRPKCQ